MRWLIVLLATCGPSWDYPTLAEQIADIDRVHNQEAVWKLQRDMYHAEYPDTIPDITVEPGRLRVFWIDNPCPAVPTRNAIITEDGGCLAGHMRGCAQIYVATNQDRPERTCGTALVHEYGHCQLYLATGNSGSGHRDYDYWERHLAEVRRVQCERDW